MTVRLMQWTSDQLQCDFRRVNFTNKLTRRTSITKLFCEWRRERVNLRENKNIFGLDGQEVWQQEDAGGCTLCV
jgi:hypothetical protein